ncbi:MAG: 4-(cytidine 5'-diphospho)-2-C-methyl-D-erythritol kinase [Phormidesmis sp. RL_2_1]|nr:4-(cytidine 5'-diphospho)-2-C-methyl-D-erythritol kinase [Phormidesmis sp. RL_2_1]
MLTLIANAKINLYLEIIGNRPDGFHELVMVMQSVSLADHITLKPLKTPTIQLNCNHPQVPVDQTNLACRAVALLQKRCPNRTNCKGGVEITIDKKIPVGAGLAGGSANAAATLFGLDVLWNLGLTRTELQDIGAELGSDVPFCLAGGCAIATGRGEEVDPIAQSPKLSVVLAKYASLSVSTVWAYQTYRQQFEHTYRPVVQPTSDAVNLDERRSRLHSGPMVKALGHHRATDIAAHLFNDLEKVVLPAHPQVAHLKQVMTAASHLGQAGSGLGTLMSGSGPTVFTLAETPAQAEQIVHNIRQQISDPDLQLHTAQFTTQGIELKN